MKLFISVSSSARSSKAVPKHRKDAYLVKDVGNITFISLEPLGEKPSKQAYVKIEKDMVWDQGTENEQAVSTITYMFVPKKERNKGTGTKLFDALLSYMKKKSIPYLAFEDYSTGFWEHLSKTRKEVVFPKKFHGRIGYVCTKPNVEFPL